MKNGEEYQSQKLWGGEEYQTVGNNIHPCIYLINNKTHVLKKIYIFERKKVYNKVFFLGRICYTTKRIQNNCVKVCNS